MLLSEIVGVRLIRNLFIHSGQNAELPIFKAGGTYITAGI